MKGYLLLEDGSLFHGKVMSQVKNILGSVILNNNGTVSLTCSTTGNQSLVVKGSEQTKGDVILSDIDFQSLKSRIGKISNLQGKIVTDSLPIEYHVYDLKTFIPLGV